MISTESDSESFSETWVLPFVQCVYAFARCGSVYEAGGGPECAADYVPDYFCVPDTIERALVPPVEESLNLSGCYEK